MNAGYCGPQIAAESLGRTRSIAALFLAPVAPALIQRGNLNRPLGCDHAFRSHERTDWASKVFQVVHGLGCRCWLHEPAALL